ncbi:hypothetical protein KIL84_009821, partial [Mauremys mutica]
MLSDGTESVPNVPDIFRARTDAPERCRISLPGPEPQPESSRGVTESPEAHFRVRDGAGADRSEAGKTRRAEAGTSRWAKAAERLRKEPKVRERRPGGGRASPERAEVWPEVAERARTGRGRRPAAAPHKMADGEEVTLDGRPLQALRVADLKAALQQRGLAKSGQKSALIKRLRGALMLENLQKHSTLHATFQPNSQIGEEMSQNSFIKQYLEKQHELLQQRLQREAREAAELEGSRRPRYVLTGEGAGTVFVIDERTGNVHVTKTLDREEKAQYTLLAQAVDRASNRPLEPPSEFIIKVQDINDNPPVFPHGPYHATVPEMSDVTAQDADDPSYGTSARLVYVVLEGLPFFSVDPQSGVVRTATPNLDREAQAELLVVIQAKDMGGHAGGLSASVTVTVTLSDVNDNPPKFPQSSYQFSVLETQPPGSPVGRLRAHDPDEGANARLSYRLLDGDGPFAISTDPLGRDGILTISQPLDFERCQAYALRVEAANTQVDPLYIRQGPFKDVATVHVAVEDAAEPPAFARPSYQLGVPENSPPGTVLGKITASDLDTPSSAIRYSILPHSDPGRYFSISPQDGTLRTALPLDRETLAWHNLTVVATELDSPAQAAPVPVVVHALDVNDNVPTLAPGTEPFVCHGTRPGQVSTRTPGSLPAGGVGAGSQDTWVHGLLPPQLIQTIWALDRDEEATGTALLLRTPRLPPPGGPPLLVPLELVDGGRPPLTGTPTLTLSVCQCRPDGALRSCQPPPATGAPPGLSTAALLAILGCGASLL